jgi:hypothetical protein
LTFSDFSLENSFGTVDVDVVLRGLSPDAQNVLAKVQMLCQYERRKERAEGLEFVSMLRSNQ